MNIIMLDSLEVEVMSFLQITLRVSFCLLNAGRHLISIFMMMTLTQFLCRFFWCFALTLLIVSDFVILFADYDRYLVG